MGSDLNSRADRERHVIQMLANSRLEGMEPDVTHQKILQRYIDGTATLSDLLQDARDFALERFLVELKSKTYLSKTQHIVSHKKIY